MTTAQPTPDLLRLVLAEGHFRCDIGLTPAFPFGRRRPGRPCPRRIQHNDTTGRCHSGQGEAARAQLVNSLCVSDACDSIGCSPAFAGNRGNPVATTIDPSASGVPGSTPPSFTPPVSVHPGAPCHRDGMAARRYLMGHCVEDGFVHLVVS